MVLKNSFIITPPVIFFLALLTISISSCSKNDTTQDEKEDIESPTPAPVYSGSRTSSYKVEGIKVLADFPNVAAIQGSPSSATDIQTTNGFQANSVVQLTIPNTDTKYASTSLPTGIDVRNGIIRLWFKPIANVAGRLSRFSIELHSEGTPASSTKNYHQMDVGNAPSQFGGMLTSKSGSGRWQAFSVSVAQLIPAGSGADLTAVKFARLFLRSTAGTDVQIQLGNIEWYPNKLPKAAVVFRFDDAHLNDYAFNELKKRGYKAMIHPSPIEENVGQPGRLTLTQLKAYNEMGWQIGSQAWSTEDYTKFTAMTPEEKNDEFVKLRNWQLISGFTGGEDGSYFSQITPNALEYYPIFNKHFRSMTRFDGGFSHTLPMLYGETYPFGDPMNVRCLNGATQIWETNTSTALINYINQAITNKGVAIIAYHNEIASSGNARNGFDAVLAFIDANPGLVRVTTLDELYREFN